MFAMVVAVGTTVLLGSKKELHPTPQHLIALLVDAQNPRPKEGTTLLAPAKPDTVTGEAEQPYP
jgi:hypothetical protein